MSKIEVFVRNPYNYDVDEVSNLTGLSCGEPSLAQQSMRDECDINEIVRRFGLTGQLPTDVRAPVYADLTDYPTTYQEALGLVLQAQESFAAMPADVRSRFSNDPAAFVAFCSDDKNRAEAERLGLVFPSVKQAVTGAPSAPVQGAGAGVQGAEPPAGEAS